MKARVMPSVLYAGIIGYGKGIHLEKLYDHARIS